MENTNKTNNILLGLFLATTLLLGGFIVYDKLLKKEEVVDCPKCEEKECPQIEATECPKCESETCNCPKCEDGTNSSTSSNLGEKVTSLTIMDISEYTNKTIKIGSKTYKIVRNDDGLYINDKGGYSASNLYLTDKYAIFTENAQFDESISFALSEKGIVTVKDNDYLVYDFKIVDGYLHADGAVWCGVELPKNPKPECLSHDVLIKFANNTLTVVSYK